MAIEAGRRHPLESVQPLRTDHQRRGLYAASIFALLPPLAFALYTRQAWEDFYISFRHSVHLVTDGQLTYHLGERIQGFSSPFNALLGALAYWLSGRSGVEESLWVLRAFSLVFLFLTARQLGRCLTEQGRGATVTAAVVVLLLGIESKTAAFAMNGMETPFFVFFVLASFTALTTPPAPRPLAIGTLWAGLLWCRPDGLVFVGLLSAAYLFFDDAATRLKLRRLLAAGAIAAVMYVPWLWFATVYYGSPIPQPVVAKAHASGAWSVAGVLGKLAGFPKTASLIFLPPYAQYDSWPVIDSGFLVLGILVCILWLIPNVSIQSRMASFVVAGGVLYLSLIGRTFPWYLPPLYALSLPCLYELCAGGRGMTQPSGARRAWPSQFLMMLVGVGLLYGFVGYTRAAAALFEVNERGNRIPIGRWLRKHASPGDSVYLECPGFIGFYSGLRILDFPGLVSPEVATVVAESGPWMHRVGWALRPDWMVLRPSEFAMFKQGIGEPFARTYAVAAVFDVRTRFLAACPSHPAGAYDSTFIILKKK